MFPIIALRANTFYYIVFVNESREISLISLRRCSTPISSGSVASTLVGTLTNFLIIFPSPVTSSTEKKHSVGKAYSFLCSTSITTAIGFYKYFLKSSLISMSCFLYLDPVVYHPTIYSD